MTICDKIGNRLAEQGLAILDHDRALRDHVNGCPHCRRFVECLKQLDAALDQLPVHAAPAELLAKTAAAVATASRPQGAKRYSNNRQRSWASLFAVAAVVLAVIGISPAVFIPLRLLQDFAPSSSSSELKEKIGNFESRQAETTADYRYYQDKTVDLSIAPADAQEPVSATLLDVDGDLQSTDEPFFGQTEEESARKNKERRLAGGSVAGKLLEGNEETQAPISQSVRRGLLETGRASGTSFWITKPSATTMTSPLNKKRNGLTAARSIDWLL